MPPRRPRGATVLERLGERLYAWLWGRRLAQGGACWVAIGHAHTVAGVVAPAAPPARVEQYVAEIARIERNARHSRAMSTFFGGLVPGFMWAFGVLTMGWGNGWSVVAAQCTWGLIWFGYGGPRFDFSIVENEMMATYLALRPLCDSVGQDVLARAGVQITRPE